MEPRKPELDKHPQARPEEKPKRFRLIKLEERIAPSNPHTLNGNGCYTGHCTAYCKSIE